MVRIAGHTYEVVKAQDDAPDSFHVKVWDPDGNLVFDLSGPLTQGNLTATTPNP